ncbi:hypothetical protein NDU88_004322 [Pleurodeles waltl]|uniref:Uncharacterized protein n=1 Tax=Pleurodeles waltl TaxID=8319 RepID=A0AAV7M7K2_PLEWA|nr:hypothetical protein NDU88_004322 [Pleurodeles waltl]
MGLGSRAVALRGRRVPRLNLRRGAEGRCQPGETRTGREARPITPARDASAVHTLAPPSTMVDPAQGATIDRILQEIAEVGSKMEGMDSAMASLTAETKSMRLDIAGFQSQAMGLEQRVSMVETHITTFVDRDQEPLYL